MKRIVLTFGLISGGILALMMVLTIPFSDRIGFEKMEVLGYTTMLVAFLLTFFGIRSYRDNVAGGTVRFGRGFAVGAYITLVASTMYVGTWQVLYRTVASDFGEKYTAHMIEQSRAAGIAPSELAAKEAEMKQMFELYKNPLVNIGMTFLEVLPIGLVVALVSAGVLSRKQGALAT